MKPLNFIVSILVVSLLTLSGSAQNLDLKIASAVTTIEAEFSEIPKNRIAELNQIAYAISRKTDKNQSVSIILADLNASEKVQLGAVWLRTGLEYYNIDNIDIVIAGLHSPLMNRSLDGIDSYGFTVSSENNGRYSVRYGNGSWEFSPILFKDAKEAYGGDLTILFESNTMAAKEKSTIALPMFKKEYIAREMIYLAFRLNSLKK
ncbi:hypothetical protein [Luteirhabdus pelagi]|uniref:hypothetical protein n=1 Tax=Luteirhabdus pelagi TaxID=2792783 RepID=UPI001939F698|nr:hypothetical protein [Luteirhabdus pelagi]